MSTRRRILYVHISEFFSGTHTLVHVRPEGNAFPEFFMFLDDRLAIYSQRRCCVVGRRNSFSFDEDGRAVSVMGGDCLNGHDRIVSEC